MNLLTNYYLRVWSLDIKTVFVEECIDLGSGERAEKEGLSVVACPPIHCPQPHPRKVHTMGFTRAEMEMVEDML